jgi:hypothetical protein
MDDNNENDMEDEHRENYMGLLLNILISTIITLSKGLYDKQVFHHSVLSGYGWVLELLSGHPEYIRVELGVHIHVFEALLAALRRFWHEDSRHVKLEEQLVIFLYACVTGLSLRHLGGRFQRSNETISV